MNLWTSSPSRRQGLRSEAQGSLCQLGCFRLHLLFCNAAEFGLPYSRSFSYASHSFTTGFTNCARADYCVLSAPCLFIAVEYFLCSCWYCSWAGEDLCGQPSWALSTGELAHPYPQVCPCIVISLCPAHVFNAETPPATRMCSRV